MDSPLWLLVTCAVGVVPLAALVVALVALDQTSRLRREVGELRRQLGLFRSGPAAAPRAMPAAPPAAGTPTAPVSAPVQPSAFPGAFAAPSPASTVPAAPGAGAADAGSAELASIIQRVRVSSHGAPVALARPGAGVVPPPLPVPAPRRAEAAGGFERQLVMRVGMVIVSIALALAAILGLHDALAKGLLTPMLGVVLGLAAGVVLLALSEWRARRNPQIATALAAAGVATLYATFLAGSNLPSRQAAAISPLVGFLGAAVTTALAVGLSLQFGVLVAAVGLIGGFLTPAIINTGNPQVVPLFGYLFLLEAGLVIVSRRRGWALLAIGAVLASMIWVVAWIVLVQTETIHRDFGYDGHVLALFILAATVCVILTSVPGKDDAAWKERSLAAGVLTWIAVLLGLILTAVLLGFSEYTLLDWLYIGLLSGGCLVLARLRPAYEGLVAIAAGLAGGMLLIGGLTHAHMHGANGPLGMLVPAALGQVADHTVRWTGLIVGYGVLFGVGSYGCAWGSRRPMRWMILSAAAAIAAVLIAYAVLPIRPVSDWWAVVPLCVAGVYAGLSGPVARRRATMPTGEDALAALLLGVLALLAIAVPMALTQAWLTAVLSLLIPLAVLAAQRLRVPALQTAAAALGAIVAARLLLNGQVLEYPAHDLLWNPFVYGYGIPILASAATAWLLHAAPRAHRALAESFTLILCFALATLEIRLGFHPDELTGTTASAMETATYAVAWLALGWLALRVARAVGGVALRYISWAIIGVATVLALCGLGLATNPLWNGWDVGGTTILNRLLYVYGVPAALATAIALSQWKRKDALIARLLGVAALSLLFLLVTLEVRQGFQGRRLDGPWPAQWEMWIYSVAWIGFGGLLLAAGLVARGLMLRWASLVVVLLTTAKVFLVDLSELRDLARVLSLVGLAAALLAIMYVYQHIVFRRRDPAVNGPPPAVAPMDPPAGTPPPA